MGGFGRGGGILYKWASLTRYLNSLAISHVELGPRMTVSQHYPVAIAAVCRNVMVLLRGPLQQAKRLTQLFVLIDGTCILFRSVKMCLKRPSQLNLCLCLSLCLSVRPFVYLSRSLVSFSFCFGGTQSFVLIICFLLLLVSVLRIKSISSLS